jgi:hypothetical protein
MQTSMFGTIREMGWKFDETQRARIGIKSKRLRKMLGGGKTHEIIYAKVP